MTTPLFSLRSHNVTVHREKRWPLQWVGNCSCGKAIRCNSRTEAWEFFRRVGCR